ncbi:hypothetical protein CHGG_00179 [Chaetomium globosum CBS 148.51]|uniref:Uncharacterized protein n=1 Tax=Chaetomium globosum (strain ATCC 6205 / CBS 148.51 / DSM 1962 / NBRC 6347 / NRRL 1970) TaxID=306901 RepID=Q2HHX5_CHAGB|nr:uncharacterized protein CHGG_00179 [Chaetomium globosum CBS 148.51]EAQ91944.1 hypothetical protein CHGG_00179 [Chaetomium globosum CBS 148.51]
MSGAARSAAANHFRGALARWPKDPLRPECQLQDILAKRLEKGKLAPVTAGAKQEQADIKQANALYSLLEDRYKNKVCAFWHLQGTCAEANLAQYRPAAKIFEPQSNPTYYKDLVKELEEAPTRSWLQRLGKRLSGIVRMG